MSPVLAAVEQDPEGDHTCMYTSGDSGLGDLTCNLQDLGVGYQDNTNSGYSNSYLCSDENSEIREDLPKNFQNVETVDYADKMNAGVNVVEQMKAENEELQPSLDGKTANAGETTSSVTISHESGDGSQLCASQMEEKKELYTEVQQTEEDSEKLEFQVTVSDAAQETSDQLEGNSLQES